MSQIGFVEPELGNLLCLVLDRLQTYSEIYLNGFTFNVTYNKGYNFFGVDGPSVYSLYVKGTWRPRVPYSKRRRKPLKTLSVDVRCQYGGKNTVGTVATGRCKMGYLMTEKANTTPTVCKENGDWSNDLVDCATPVAYCV